MSLKRYTAACVVAACIGLVTSLPAQQQTLVLWPNGNPEPSHMPGPEYDPTTDVNRIVAGKVTVRVANGSLPNLAVYLEDSQKSQDKLDCIPWGTRDRKPVTDETFTNSERYHKRVTFSVCHGIKGDGLIRVALFACFRWKMELPQGNSGTFTTFTRVVRAL